METTQTIYISIFYTEKLSKEAVVNCWEDELTPSPPDLISTSDAADSFLSFARGKATFCCSGE
jgi:hypothetical protein